MRFTVPQFIERESPVAGPLTFKQLILVGGAAILCVVLHFIIDNFVLFVILSIFTLGTGAAMAFLKIEGFSIPVILANLLKFNASPKIYLWSKKTDMLEDQIIKEKRDNKNSEN
jgi:hypothetical protein